MPLLPRIPIRIWVWASPGKPLLNLFQTDPTGSLAELRPFSSVLGDEHLERQNSCDLHLYTVLVWEAQIAEPVGSHSGNPTNIPSSHRKHIKPSASACAYITNVVFIPITPFSGCFLRQKLKRTKPWFFCGSHTYSPYYCKFQVRKKERSGGGHQHTKSLFSMLSDLLQPGHVDQLLLS